MDEPFAPVETPEGTVLEAAPQVDPAGQALAPLPPAAPLVATMPRLPIPPSPPLPPSPMQDPKQKLLALAALGFALGAGRQSGMAQGAMHGLLNEQAQLHQDNLTQWKVQADEAKRQQQDVLTQQNVLDRQNQTQIEQTFANLRKSISAAPDEEKYRQQISLYAGGLQSLGVRIPRPQLELQLQSQFPYAPQTEEQQIKEKLGELYKQPQFKELPPEGQLASSITIKRKGSPDVQLPVGEALKRIGLGVPTTDAQGNPLFSSIPKGPIAEQAWARAQAEFRIQYGRAPNPGKSEDNDWLTKRAEQITPRSSQATSTDASYMLAGKPIVAVRTNGRLMYRGQDVTDQVTPYVAPKEAPDKLTKVEHVDPATGRAVIEWLPQSDLRGKTFQKPVGQTVENRLASATAVSQTGNDIIAELSDPNVAKVVGPAMGRAGSLRDFIGNPPPQFSELAGSIESYALASMGVHGMRSAQGAERIKKLLDGHHTPESLIGGIRGLNKFSAHFMENEGRSVKPPATTPGRFTIAPIEAQ